jgi:hypothetical protein
MQIEIFLILESMPNLLKFQVNQANLRKMISRMKTNEQGNDYFLPFPGPVSRAGFLKQFNCLGFSSNMSSPVKATDKPSKGPSPCPSRPNHVESDNPAPGANASVHFTNDYGRVRIRHMVEKRPGASLVKRSVGERQSIGRGQISQTAAIGRRV